MRQSFPALVCDGNKTSSALRAASPERSDSTVGHPKWLEGWRYRTSGRFSLGEAARYGKFSLQRRRSKRIAILQALRIHARLEPAHALFTRAVGEAFGDHVALAAFLQAVIADGGGGV
jgi:hypothetical protein